MNGSEPPPGGYSGGYGSHGPPGPPYGQYSRPSNGVTILVLAILGVVTGCFPLATVAWVMGNQSMREIKSGIMDPREEGIVQAGRIVGMVWTILAALALFAYCGIFALACGIGAAGVMSGR